ncbi:ABC transporter permease [Corynebacterium sp. HS2168-gen11]|uniref:ABC transporter permease n=1 Tax=Corynebacterium sp. HS2168-gen11 TaxID=2974027 RepID=UPI00216B4E24|nr:ABC transporter permease [Corynebacterium sp. HS2168-gen11]MCS4535678.1 ABC transporter permease [Corynebacterium sp. HS2168-gen11]
MSLVESLRLALGNIRGNKLRSFLTLIGVVIGIASVIAILTLGQALRSSTSNSLASFGGADFTVRVQEIPTEEDLQAVGGNKNYYYAPPTDKSANITAQMIEELRANFGPDIANIAIGDNNTYGATVSSDLVQDTQNTELQFVNADFFKMRDVRIEHGRSFTEEEIAANAPVVVVSPVIVDTLFHGNPSEALGSQLNFETDNGFGSFTIIGVEKSGGGGGLLAGLIGPQTKVYVPYTLEIQVNDDAAGSWELIAVRKAIDVDTEEFETALKDHFNLYYEGDTANEVIVRDNSKDVESFNKVISSISGVIAAIAGISLFVGGIGVMNIMLITVTERTREIGIRKALGATRRDIRRQFVIEAMVVCLIGGIFGILIGSLFGMIGASFLGGAVAPPLWGVALSMFFCLAIGVFFGWYPANRAAKLDPIEALRHE